MKWYLELQLKRCFLFFNVGGVARRWADGWCQVAHLSVLSHSALELEIKLPFLLILFVFLLVHQACGHLKASYCQHISALLSDACVIWWWEHRSGSTDVQGLTRKCAGRPVCSCFPALNSDVSVKHSVVSWNAWKMLRFGGGVVRGTSVSAKQGRALETSVTKRVSVMHFCVTQMHLCQSVAMPVAADLLLTENLTFRIMKSLFA